MYPREINLTLEHLELIDSISHSYLGGEKAKTKLLEIFKKSTIDSKEFVNFFEHLPALIEYGNDPHQTKNLRRDARIALRNSLIDIPPFDFVSLFLIFNEMKVSRNRYSNKAYDNLYEVITMFQLRQQIKDCGTKDFLIRDSAKNGGKEQILKGIEKLPKDKIAIAVTLLTEILTKGTPLNQFFLIPRSSLFAAKEGNGTLKRAAKMLEEKQKELKLIESPIKEKQLFKNEIQSADTAISTITSTITMCKSANELLNFIHDKIKFDSIESNANDELEIINFNTIEDIQRLSQEAQAIPALSVAIKKLKNDNTNENTNVNNNSNSIEDAFFSYLKKAFITSKDKNICTRVNVFFDKLQQKSLWKGEIFDNLLAHQDKLLSVLCVAEKLNFDFDEKTLNKILDEIDRIKDLDAPKIKDYLEKDNVRTNVSSNKNSLFNFAFTAPLNKEAKHDNIFEL